MFTDEQIKKLSTQRLLTIFRMVRKNLYCREPDDGMFDSSEGYDNHDDYDLFDRLKGELDTREHVPRKTGKPKCR